MDIKRIERRLKLHDVRVLLSVAQTGSMHKAAQHLGTSQPAVSRSIADLEQTLGVRLFDRGRRGVEPTHYGRAIIKCGAAVFDEIRQGVKNIEFLADPAAGELRIGSTEAAAAGPGLAVIDRLAARYPRIAFNILTAGRTALYHHLAERNVELVIAGIASDIPEQFVVERLFDDSMVVAAGIQNPWARRRRIELAELAHEPWTLPPADTDPGALTMEAFRASGLEPPRTAVVSGSRYFRDRLLTTGRFLSMIAGYSLSPPGNNPLIKALPVELPDLRRPIVILTLKKRTLSPLAELFIRTAREAAKSLAKRK
jgi:DNA-binding transcriptional LysR family regulator